MIARVASACLLGLGCMLALMAAPSPCAAQTVAPLRRFALLVGENEGGEGRPTLRYAVSDAEAVARVLEELGGVRASDRALLTDPDAGRIERAFAEKVAQVETAQRAGQRTELVFYYSGHSDEHGLRLGDALVSYEQLKRWLESVPADVRIAVLDSCASGTLTRLKGGVQVAPFLFDQSVEVRGQAILTASSESEAAQESDRIGGSYFTHYFVSGLRGAADTSADGRVTLTEAYRFAFDETLSRTGTTRAGAQHPAYDFQLAGTGDLVMTDLRSTQARLVLDASFGGRLYVRDADGRLVAELVKQHGKSMSLALPPGAYALVLETPERRMGARVELRVHSPVPVSKSAFRVVVVEDTATRGAGLRLVPVAASFVPPFDTYHAARGPVQTYLGVHALYGEPDVLTGVAIALGVNGARARADGVQLGLLANRAGAVRGLQLAGLVNAADAPVRGLELGLLGNLARDEVRGAQLSLGFNAARAARGLRLGAVNVAREEVRGVSIGALDVSRRLDGISWAGVSWGGQVRGAQLAGVSLAREVRGVQLGFVNVASGDVHGAQIGLLNVARRTDVGLAPISITRDGGVHAQVLSGSFGLLQLALRFDARYTYSFFGAVVHPLGKRPHRAYALGGGFGAKIPIAWRLSAETDLGAYVAQPWGHWDEGLPHVLAQARLGLRLELHKYLSVIVGGAFDLFVESEPARVLEPGFDHGRRRLSDARSRVDVRSGPGWFVGLRF